MLHLAKVLWLYPFFEKFHGLCIIGPAINQSNLKLYATYYKLDSKNRSDTMQHPSIMMHTLLPSFLYFPNLKDFKYST